MQNRTIGTGMSSRLLCICAWFYIPFMILSWNVCGLGSSSKRKAINKYIKDFNVIVCFIIETKLSCSDSMVSSLWHGHNIKWFSIEAQGRSGGLLAMWDEDLFRVDSIEYAGSWISLFGSFVDDAFECVITGIMELALELKE